MTAKQKTFKGITTTRASKPKPAGRSRKASPKNNYSMRSLDQFSPVLWNNSNSVTAETAIRVTAILACVRFIAQSIASMPLHIFRTMPDRRKQLASDLPVYGVLCKRPNGWMSQYEWLEIMGHHTALYGNGYSRIVPGDRGFCSELIPLHPSRMTVKRLSDGSLSYVYLTEQNQLKPYGQDEILHFRWLSDNGYTGMMPAELCATSVQLARKLDTAASAYWDNSGRPDVVLETAESIPQEAVEQLRRQWRDTFAGAKNKGKTAVLPRKVTAKTLVGNSAESAQMMDLRASIVSECARAFGVPSTLVGDVAMAKYSNVEQEYLSAQVFCLLPWQRRFEGAIDRSILSTYGDAVYAKLDSRGLLRGDSVARAQYYQTLFNLAAISPNEIRSLEDLDLLEDPAADLTYMQLGFAPLHVAAQPPTIPGA